MSEQEKPLTFKQFIEFYRSEIEPRFHRIEKKLETHDQRFDQIDIRMDELYKKFEALYMEYKVMTQQFKEIETGLDQIRELPKTLTNLKAQLLDLYRRVEELEKQYNTH